MEFLSAMVGPDQLPKGGIKVRFLRFGNLGYIASGLQPSGDLRVGWTESGSPRSRGTLRSADCSFRRAFLIRSCICEYAPIWRCNNERTANGLAIRSSVARSCGEFE